MRNILRSRKSIDICYFLLFLKVLFFFFNLKAIQVYISSVFLDS